MFSAWDSEVWFEVLHSSISETNWICRTDSYIFLDRSWSWSLSFNVPDLNSEAYWDAPKLKIINLVAFLDILFLHQPATNLRNLNKCERMNAIVQITCFCLVFLAVLFSIYLIWSFRFHQDRCFDLNDQEHS